MVLEVLEVNGVVILLVLQDKQVIQAELHRSHVQVLFCVAQPEEEMEELAAPVVEETAVVLGVPVETLTTTMVIQGEQMVKQIMVQ